MGQRHDQVAVTNRDLMSTRYSSPAGREIHFASIGKAKTTIVYTKNIVPITKPRKSLTELSEMRPSEDVVIVDNTPNEQSLSPSIQNILNFVVGDKMIHYGRH